MIQRLTLTLTGNQCTLAGNLTSSDLQYYLPSDELYTYEVNDASIVTDQNEDVPIPSDVELTEDSINNGLRISTTFYIDDLPTSNSFTAITAYVDIDVIHNYSGAIVTTIRCYSDTISVNGGSGGDDEDPELQPIGEFYFYLDGDDVRLTVEFDYGSFWSPSGITILKNGAYDSFITPDNYESFDTYIGANDGDYEATLQFDYNGYEYRDPETFSAFYPPEDDEETTSIYLSENFVVTVDSGYIEYNSNYEYNLLVISYDDDGLSFWVNTSLDSINISDINSGIGYSIEDILIDNNASSGNYYVELSVHNPQTGYDDAAYSSNYVYWNDLLVAEYYGEKYSTLEEAIIEANLGGGGTITLLRNIGTADVRHTLDSSMEITQPIIIEGQYYEMFLTGNVNVFQVNNDFTLMNIEIDHNPTSNNAIIYDAVDSGADITISNATLTTTGRVLVLADRTSGTITVEGTSFNSNATNAEFNVVLVYKSKATLYVNSTEIVSKASAFKLTTSTAFVRISDNSSIICKGSTAFYVDGPDKSTTEISDSTLTSRDYVIDTAGKNNTIIKLMSGAEIDARYLYERYPEITQGAGIAMNAGSSGNNQTIIIYKGALIRAIEGARDIYFTEKVTEHGRNIYFVDGYDKVIVRSGSTSTANYWFYNTIKEALTASKGSWLYIPQDISTSETASFPSRNLRVLSAPYVDATTLKEISKTCTINYFGTSAAFEINNSSYRAIFDNINIEAHNGAACIITDPSAKLTVEETVTISSGKMAIDNTKQALPVLKTSESMKHGLYGNLYTLIDTANATNGNIIHLTGDINLNKTSSGTDSSSFEIIDISKNIIIDGNDYKIIGEHADEENPKNQFQSMFYVKSSDITFTLKNIEIDYTSYTSNHYQGVIIYNANVDATMNVENSTLVGSKGIYSNNADSTINILGSTIIGTMSAAIILSSVLSNTRTQKVTIDSSFIAATGPLGCIATVDSNTNLVIKGSSIVDPIINNYAGYESLAPTTVAIYVAAGLNNEAEYYPTITIYDTSRVYNGPERSNGKYYGAIYSNGDNFTRPINVQFGDDYDGPAFICNTIKLASGQLFYGYFYDEKSQLFESFSTSVPDNFGDDIYVLLGKNTDINNTITLTKNLTIQKATIVNANGEVIDKVITMESAQSTALLLDENSDLIVCIKGINTDLETIIDGFANIAYKTGDATIYQKFETALDNGYRIYALSEKTKNIAKEAGHTIKFNDNIQLYEVIRKPFSYFKNQELNDLWNRLVYGTEYVIQSKLVEENGYNTGLIGIHNALIYYTGLNRPNEAVKNNNGTPGEYMKGIAVCARYLGGVILPETAEEINNLEKIDLATIVSYIEQ